MYYLADDFPLADTIQNEVSNLLPTPLSEMVHNLFWHNWIIFYQCSSMYNEVDTVLEMHFVSFSRLFHNY